MAANANDVPPVLVRNERLQFNRVPDALVQQHRRQQQLERRNASPLWRFWMQCLWLIPWIVLAGFLIVGIVLLIQYVPTYHPILEMNGKFFADMSHATQPPSTTEKLPTLPPPTPTPLPAVRQYMPFELIPHGNDATLPPMNGTWFNGTQLLFTTAAEQHPQQVLLADMRTGKRTVLLDVPDHNTLESYSLSSDGEYLLLGARVDAGADSQRSGILYSTVDMRWPNVSLNERTRRLGLMHLAVFGPLGSQLVTVEADNNLRYMSSARPGQMEFQITADGSDNILYGMCDFAYEREVFTKKSALWFSSNGEWLAFASFDDEFVMSKSVHKTEPFGWKTSWAKRSVPNNEELLKIPMPGMINPRVQLYVTRLAETYVGLMHRMPLPAALPNVLRNEAMLAAVHWTSDTRVVAVWLNRAQTKAFVQTCTIKMKCQLTVSIANSGGWLRYRQPVLFSRADLTHNNDLAIVQAVQHKPFGGSGRYPIDQIVLYGLDKPGTFVALQPDTNHVERIVHWDKQYNVLFYLGNTQRRPEQRHLFAVRVDMLDAYRSDCVTCALSVLRGWAYTHFDVMFSEQPGSRMLVLESQGPSVPRHDVFEWTGGMYSVVDSRPVGLRHVRTLQTHAALREPRINVTMSVLRYEQVRLRNGRMANVKLLLPESYEVQCKPMVIAAANYSGARTERTFSLLVRAYDGPDSFAGRSDWTNGYEEYLTVNRSVVVAIVDAHGSSRTDLQRKYAVYSKLGWMEADDLLDVTQKLTHQLRCVDPQSVGVTGMYYSGYVAAMALYADRVSEVFQCALLGAPFDTWMSVLSLYAERYMGPLSAAYLNSSLDYNLSDLTNRSVYLVHDLPNGEFDWSLNLYSIFKAAGVPQSNNFFPGIGSAINSRLYYQNLNKFFGSCFNWE